MQMEQMIRALFQGFEEAGEGQVLIKQAGLPVWLTGGGGGAPTDAEYLVGAAHTGLSAERVVTDTTTIAWDLLTAGQAKAAVPLAALTLAHIQNQLVVPGILGATVAGPSVALTPTAVTALLDVFTTALKGLAPASGGGTTNFLRADGTWAAPAGGGGGGPWTVVKKTADESINNNTLQDDDHLFFTMAANTTYFIRMYVFLQTGATPDFKYRISNVGGTITLIRRAATRGSGATSATYPTAVVGTAFDAADVVITATGTPSQGFIIEEMIVQVGGTGGTWKFQWAQNTTTAGTPAIVYAGSYLEYWSNP